MCLPRLRVVPILVVLAACMVLGAGAESATAPAAEPALSPSRCVFVLPVHGPIDKSLLFVFRRAFREVRALSPVAIVVDLDTPGGGLHETEEIISWLHAAKVPLYAFVNPRALSAGAIISLATDRIFMAEGGRIGSAMPILLSPFSGTVQDMPEGINEKVLSDTRALVRNLAQRKGHDEDIAMAMVDRDRGLETGGRVICRKGELLNLTAREAIEVIPPRAAPLLAEAIVPDIPALLAHAGVASPKLVRFEEKPAERLARYITLIGPVLLALGALGIYIEFKTPGFGLPGILGVVLLVVYFFGHYVAGLAGIEDIVLVLLGLVLLGLEVFLLPGVGILGILGIGCILAGTILGMVPRIPRIPLPLPSDAGGSLLTDYFVAALSKTAGALVFGGIGVWLLARYLPRTPVYRDLVLQTSLTQEAGYVSGQAAGQQSLVGREGIALTSLRPAGTVAMGEQRLDVVSSGDLVPPGSRVRVIEVEGARIVVEKIPA